jgi:hypothetical protein
LTGGLPEFGTPFGGSFRRIVQTPGGISMFYDVGQGQGWQRNIVMNGSPHLPGDIRQWYGDSRGHWEGNTLVIDVTNFSPKTDYQGSRENLHVVERWTRTGPTSLEYVVTIEDPTVWTRPWSVKQDFTRQSDQENICCMDDAWKSAPLRRDEAMTRQLDRDDISCSPIVASLRR